MGKTKRFQELNKGYVRDSQANSALAAWEPEIAVEEGIGHLMAEGASTDQPLIADIPPSTPAATNPFAQLLAADLPPAPDPKAPDPKAPDPKTGPQPADAASPESHQPQAAAPTPAPEAAPPKKKSGLAKVLAWLRSPE